jgi:hypothetical protein
MNVTVADRGVTMKAIITGAVMALATTAAGATEDVSSANYMMAGCRAILEGNPASIQAHTRPEIYGEGVCAGALLTWLAVSASHMTAGRECLDIPLEVNVERAAQIVIRYVDARPQRIHEPFIPLVFEALHDAWPCPATEFDKRFNGK